jgi:heme/copper-type cytochrome/quinol oxidase subunit 2
MFSLSKNHIKFPKVLGFIFVCIGILMGYSAVEVILDPNATILVNDMIRKDMEAKIIGLLIPVIFIVVGLVLSFSTGNTLKGFNKLRDEINSGLSGK